VLHRLPNAGGEQERVEEEGTHDDVRNRCSLNAITLDHHTVDAKYMP
jgi:hypothetical protein